MNIFIKAMYESHQVSFFQAFYIYSKIITQGSNNLSNIFYLWTYVQLFFLIINF